MTMFMMKKPNDKANPNDDIFMVVYTMLFMNFIEYVFKHIPKLSEVAKGVALAYFTKKTKELQAWICGHSHSSKRVLLKNNVELMMNCKGYRNEEIKNFNLTCIYEIHEKLNTNLEDQ